MVSSLLVPAVFPCQDLSTSRPRIVPPLLVMERPRPAKGREIEFEGLLKMVRGRGAVRLLACDDDSGAKTLCTWWQLAHPIFSRVLCVEHCCCFGVGRDNQEGLITIARRGIHAQNRPLPCAIRSDLALRIDQSTKCLRLQAQEYVLLRSQFRKHPFHGDPLTHGGSRARRRNTRWGG